MKITREIYKLRTSMDYLIDLLADTNQYDNTNDNEIYRQMDVINVMLKSILADAKVNNIHYAKKVHKFKMTDFQQVKCNVPFILNEFDTNVYVKKLVGKNFYLSNVTTGISTLVSPKSYLTAVYQIID